MKGKQSPKLNPVFAAWDHQGHKGYVCISSKNWSNGQWEDKMFRYPTNSAKSKIKKYVKDQLDIPNTDVYFTPQIFSKARRISENAMPSRVLYSDLDKAKPQEMEKLVGAKPTLAWMSSKDNHQALWFIDQPLPCDKFERINHNLTFTSGGDMNGGWISTKVLRIPGILNNKPGYNDEQRKGKLLWFEEDLIHPLDEFDLKEAPLRLMNDDDFEVTKNSDTFLQLLNLYKKDIPLGIRQRLKSKELPKCPDRSGNIYRLCKDLYMVKIPLSDIFHLINKGPWSEKYSRNSKGLRKTIARAAEAAENEKKLRTSFKQEDYDLDAEASSWGKKPYSNRKNIVSDIKVHVDFSLLSNEERMDFEKMSSFKSNHKQYKESDEPKPRWLIQDILPACSTVIMAGPPKCHKSTISTSMALSVSTGIDFLNSYSVEEPGKVVLFTLENSNANIKYTNERVEEYLTGLNKKKLQSLYEGKYKDTGLPIDIYNRDEPFNITKEGHRVYLANIIKKEKPRLVIIDPLYRAKGDLDANSEDALKPYLTWLEKLCSLSKEVEEDIGTTILVIHHTRKPGKNPKTGKILTQDEFDIKGSQVLTQSFESIININKLSATKRSTVLDMSYTLRDFNHNPTKRIAFDNDHNTVSVSEVDEEMTGEPASPVEIRGDEETLINYICTQETGVKKEQIAKDLGWSQQKVNELVKESISKGILRMNSHWKIFLTSCYEED